MNVFNSGLLVYVLSSSLDNLIKLSFCLLANSSEFVLVHWVLLKYIGRIMRIASATSGREFIDPRGHRVRGLHATNSNSARRYRYAICEQNAYAMKHDTLIIFSGNIVDNESLIRSTL